MKQSVLSYDPRDAIDLITEHEGCRLKAYKDPLGIWTIGYGHTSGVKPGDSITKEEARILLMEDISKFHEELATLVKVPVGPNQFIALMDFLYNFGCTKCRGYSLFKELNKGHYKIAASKFPDYRNPGSSIEEGLLKRRLKEQELFLRDENV